MQSLSGTAQGILTLAAHPVKTTANVLAIFEFDPVGAQIGRPVKIKDEVLLSAADAIGQGVEDFAAADANHKVRTTGFVVTEIAQFLVPITKASKAKYASEAGKTAEEMKYLQEADNLGKVGFNEMMDVSQLRLLQNMDVQQTAKYVEELKRLKETANATKAVKASTGTAEDVAKAATKLEASWADKMFESVAKFEDHFSGHASEWPIPLTKEQYLQKARDLLSAKPSYNVEGFVSKDGWIFKYNNATNEFAIGRPDGVISTVFRPVDGRTYWLEQIKLYGGDSVVFGGN